jgi:hypothetical protein
VNALPPVRKSVIVPLVTASAFDLFVRRLPEWRERLGERASFVRAIIDGGWPGLLARFEPWRVARSSCRSWKARAASRKRSTPRGDPRPTLPRRQAPGSGVAPRHPVYHVDNLSITQQTVDGTMNVTHGAIH